MSALTPASPIAFIGTGAIGTPMALRLLATGRRLTAVDPCPSAELSRRDDVVIASSFDAVPDDDRPAVAVVMVATPGQLEEVVTTALASKANLSGQHWIIMSTVGPDAVRTQGARLVQAGARVVDSPVTGGVARARTGTLTLFTSGADGDLTAVRDVLDRFGTVREVGSELGQGQAIKLVNQHLCSVHLVAAAESLALAERLGLDPERVLPLVASGAAGSFMLSDRGPRMLQDTDVEVMSTIGIFVKDSGLVTEAAADVGAQTPLLDTARRRFLQAADSGLERRDDSRVVETYTTDD